MNRREFLKSAGVLCTVAVLALYASPGDAADPAPVIVLVTYHSATGNTEKMAQGVAEGAKTVSGTSVVLKPVDEVIGDDLLSADAVIVGSPVYVGSMSWQVKTFLDNCGPSLVLELDPEICATRSERHLRLALQAPTVRKSRCLPFSGLCSATEMIVISAGGPFGRFGASATTGSESPSIDAKEITEARELGKRVAEVAALVKRGSGK